MHPVSLTFTESHALRLWKLTWRAGRKEKEFVFILSHIHGEIKKTNFSCAEDTNNNFITFVPCRDSLSQLFRTISAFSHYLFPLCLYLISHILVFFVYLFSLYIFACLLVIVSCDSCTESQKEYPRGIQERKGRESESEKNRFLCDKPTLTDREKHKLTQCSCRIDERVVK